MMVDPFKFLKESIRAVPSVKYALGVAGISSVIAIISAFKIDFRVAFLGTIVILILMVVLLIFANLTTTNKKHFKIPVTILTYFSLLSTICFSTLIISSVFFKKPLNLQHWLGIQDTVQSSFDKKDLLISGRVIDAISNKPVSKVIIKLEGFKENFFTEDNGNFNIELHNTSINTKRLRIMFDKEDYYVVDMTIVPPATSLIIPMRAK